MTNPQMREQADRVRSIPLPSVLLAAGAEPDPYDEARWHTPKGVVSVTGMKFFNWTLNLGGGGAIDLIIHLNGLDFKSAVAWLSSHFPDCTSIQTSCVTSGLDLKMPEPDKGKLSIVKHYLTHQRRLRVDLIERLFQSGDIYADNRANAVFLLRGKHDAPVGAELRGTGNYPWRGMAPGSRKNLGYFSVRGATVDGIILCESAIDAISCFVIHPHHCCISTAGARPNPSWLPQLIEMSQPVYCGFDSDPTGDAMVHAMSKLYPTIKRLRPEKHDWNCILSSQP